MKPLYDGRFSLLSGDTVSVTYNGGVVFHYESVEREDIRVVLEAEKGTGHRFEQPVKAAERERRIGLRTGRVVKR